MVKNIMAMCDKSGQFIFQVRPDIFPHGRITKDEMLLWEKYYEEKEMMMEAKKRNG